MNSLKSYKCAFYEHWVFSGSSLTLIKVERFWTMDRNERRPHVKKATHLINKKRVLWYQELGNLLTCWGPCGLLRGDSPSLRVGQTAVCPETGGGNYQFWKILVLKLPNNWPYKMLTDGWLDRIGPQELRFAIWTLKLFNLITNTVRLCNNLTPIFQLFACLTLRWTWTWTLKALFQFLDDDQRRERHVMKENV